MSAQSSLSPFATSCIREAAEEVRDVAGLKVLGLVLDKMELRHAGFVANDIPVWETRRYIERRITEIVQHKR
jgi:hypothetical protein